MTWSVRRVARRLLPERTRRFLNLIRVSLDEASAPALVSVPPGRSVLVLAPHPDDEVAGCGGTLAIHARQGARVTVVHMTDGRLGSLRLETLCGAERQAFQSELVRTRKAEAAAAARILGVGDPVALDFRDGELRRTRAAIARIEELLAAHRPDIVYVPFPCDRHADHVETARIFAAAAAAADGCQVDAYEIWSPLYPTSLVDITAVADVKRRALLEFRSQIDDNNLVHSILGLNAYRSMFRLGSRGYAEAFFRCSAGEFRRLTRRLVGR